MKTTLMAASAMVLAFATAASAQEAPRWAVDPATQIPAERPATTVKPGFTFAATGDMIYALPMLPRQDAGVEALAKVVRGADAALTNQEGSIFDLETFKGYLEAQTGGGYPLGKPELAKDIAGLGFDFASKANNHSADFGIEGLLESKRHLEEAGVRTPGAGRNRAFARAAQIMDTPRGRVAVIGAASTFVGSAPAGQGEGVSSGRPGISVLRTRRIGLVPADQFESLKAVAATMGGRPSRSPDEVSLMGQTYRKGDKAGVTYDMNALDRFEILRTVRGAKNIADAAVFTIHAHENAGGDDRIPADFQQKFYREVVDAGADIVSVHGPHLTRGIEIYKGRPIFYGLGHFVFQMLGSAPNMRENFEESGTDPRFVANGDSDMGGYPSSWYDGAVAVTEFGEGGAVKEIRLFPIDMREKAQLKTRGIPQLATGDKARQILEQIRKDSAVYGTDIRIENGVGIIRPAG